MKTNWKDIEEFLDLIHEDRIKNLKYYMFGYQEQYRKTEVYNYGYIPFYNSYEVVKKEQIIPDLYKCNRPAILKTSTQYITVHDTASGAPTADEQAHSNWLMSMATDKDNKNSVSWHFTVGDKMIIQHLPTKEVAHHAGDGYREYGSTYYNTTYNKECITGGNLNSVGIESCVNYGSDYTITMRNLADLISDLLIEFNLPITAVKQHNDFSGKDCPMTIRHANRWDELLHLVDIDLKGKTKFKDVVFKWESLNKNIMDDTGKIINHPNKEVLLKYKVTVINDKEVKEYIKESTLEELRRTQ